MAIGHTDGGKSPRPHEEEDRDEGQDTIEKIYLSLQNICRHYRQPRSENYERRPL